MKGKGSAPPALPFSDPTISAYRRLKAGIEVERPIAIGVLKIKAKLGELMPAKSPKESGAMKGKGSYKVEVPFHPRDISGHRKIAKHVDRLTEYSESIEDVPAQHRSPPAARRLPLSRKNPLLRGHEIYEPTPEEIEAHCKKFREQHLAERRALDYHRHDQPEPKVIATIGFIRSDVIDRLQG